MTELKKLKEFALDWFRYAHPVMSPKVKEKDPFGAVIITYLQNICSNLLRYGRKDFSFITFLEIYATTASSPIASPTASPAQSDGSSTLPDTSTPSDSGTIVSD